MDPAREFSNPEGTWCVWGNLGGPNILITNTTPQPSYHTCFPNIVLLSTWPHMVPTWTSLTIPAVFFWYLFIAAKIPRASGEKLLKTPQALGLTSKQLSSFFTRCFWDPCLFSPGKQILQEIFLSDITIYRTLAWTSCLYLICTCPHGPQSL